jgi:hypothetical protein
MHPSQSSSADRRASHRGVLKKAHNAVIITAVMKLPSRETIRTT